MVASVGDLSFDIWGYFLVTLNCVITAWYLVLISQKQKETQLESFGLMFYNNIFSIPILTFTVLTFEWDTVVNFKHWGNVGFQVREFCVC